MGPSLWWRAPSLIATPPGPRGGASGPECPGLLSPNVLPFGLEAPCPRPGPTALLPPHRGCTSPPRAAPSRKLCACCVQAVTGQGQGVAPPLGSSVLEAEAGSHRGQASHPAEGHGPRAAIPSLCAQGSPAPSDQPRAGSGPGLTAPAGGTHTPGPLWLGPGQPRRAAGADAWGAPLLHSHPGHTGAPRQPRACECKSFQNPSPSAVPLRPPHLLSPRRPCTLKWVGTDPLQGVREGAQRGHGARTCPAEGARVSMNPSPAAQPRTLSPRCEVGGEVVSQGQRVAWRAILRCPGCGLGSCARGVASARGQSLSGSCPMTVSGGFSNVYWKEPTRWKRP